MEKFKRLLWESKLVIALVLLVASRCTDRVLYTRMTYDYNDFLWNLSNVILPLAFIVASWPVVWYKMAFTSDITPQMKAFPHYKFAIMALYDAMSNLLSAFPTPHIGGNLANVLGQITLPFNMLLSYMFLQAKYKRCHMLGAILVMYGVLVVMIPVFRGEDTANMPDATLGWILLYIASMVPAAASNVYKEIGLKDVDLDIWYANAWVSFYQLIWGVLTVWTIRIKAFSDPPIAWSEFGSYLSKAQNCFIGNPVEFNGKMEKCDQGTLQIFMVFLIFNMIYNQLMMYIFKEGSSIMFVISSAVCLPLTNLLYMIPELAGPKAGQTFTIYDGFALFALVIGLLVYHSEKEQRQEGGKAVDKSPMFTSPTLQRTHLMKNKRGRLFYRLSPMFSRSPTTSPKSPKRPMLGGRESAAAAAASSRGYGTANAASSKKRSTSPKGLAMV